MKVNENVIYRNVAGEDMLIPIGEMAGDMDGLYVLTPTGAEIWNMLAQGQSVETIIRTLAEEYDENPKMIREDVLNVIDKLKKLNLVVED